MAEERLAAEKRRQAAQEAKVNRAKAREAASTSPSTEDNAVLDDILEKLRKGENPRRARRGRAGERGERPAIPLSVDIEPSASAGPGAETADLARDMLARLKSDGFEAFPPASPQPRQSSASRRKRRLRGSNVSKLELDFSDVPQSPPPGSATIQEEAAEVPSSPSPHVPDQLQQELEEEEWDRTIIAAVT